MATFDELSRLTLEPRKPDWLERIAHIAQVIMALAAVLALIQDKTIWFVVLLVAFILLYLPTVKQYLHKRKAKAKQQEILARFTNDFITFVNRAQDFIQSTNQYGIPYYLRNIVTRQGMEVKRFNPHVESLFAHILSSIQVRAKEESKSYEGFERALREFSEVMTYFVLIFVDDMIRELKQTQNFAALQPFEVSGLKQRYTAFNQFVNDYNMLQSKLASLRGEKEVTTQIRIPTETFD